jgi:hypothetical protein
MEHAAEFEQHTTTVVLKIAFTRNQMTVVVLPHYQAFSALSLLSVRNYEAWRT